MRALRLLRDVAMLTGRSLKVTVREPWAVVPNVAISLFFLFVYNAGLGGIGRLGHRVEDAAHPVLRQEHRLGADADLLQRASCPGRLRQPRI